MNKKLFALTLSFVFVGCAAPRLPENVSISPTADSLGRKYVTSMVFQHEMTQIPDAVFSKVKLCAAEHITNDGVDLEDSAGSFVGAYTGHFYDVHSVHTTQSGQALVMADDTLKTVIARGVVPFKGDNMLGLLYYLKFTVKARVESNLISIEFSQLQEAQQNSGLISNTGFFGLGAWAGSNAMGAYTAAEQLSNTLFACIEK